MAEVTEKPKGLPSANALDRFPIQQPLIDTAFTRFNGNSPEQLENPPDLDGERTYIVTAQCVGVDRRRRKDGEERVTAVMQITSCYEQGKVPAADDSQGGLFDDSAGEGDGS